MRKSLIFISVTTILLLTTAACNKTKQVSKRLSGETWRVTELTVDGVSEDHLPSLRFEDCDIYDESCKGEWEHDDAHAHFIWQVREKAKKFELSNQSSLEDAHDGGHEAEENILQCQNFSGVYDIKERSRSKMELTTTTALGFSGKTVVLKMEKQ